MERGAVPNDLLHSEPVELEDAAALVSGYATIHAKSASGANDSKDDSSSPLMSASKLPEKLWVNMRISA